MLAHLPVRSGDGVTGLDGRRAVVSGGSKGAGAAVVARLRAAGAATTVIARHRPDDADDFVQADITTVAGTAAVAEHVARLGGAQILVHVAGGSSAPAGGFAALTDEHWLDELQLNLLGAVRLDRALVPAMIDAGAGAIVHVGSIQARMRSTTGRSDTPRPRPPSGRTARAWQTSCAEGIGQHRVAGLHPDKCRRRTRRPDRRGGRHR